MFKSPNSKSLTSAGISVGAGIVGAKLSDGVVAILPEDMKPATKRWGLAIAALVAASAVNPNTTAGSAVQSAFVGMAVKQGADALSDSLKANIEAKTSGTKADKFINAVVGHDPAMLDLIPAADMATKSAVAKLGISAWEPAEPVYEAVEAREVQTLATFV